MTANEFAAECETRFIHPAIALEDADVQDALATRDDDQIREALDNI